MFKLFSTSPNPQHFVVSTSSDRPFLHQPTPRTPSPSSTHFVARQRQQTFVFLPWSASIALLPCRCHVNYSSIINCVHRNGNSLFTSIQFNSKLKTTRPQCTCRLYIIKYLLRSTNAWWRQKIARSQPQSAGRMWRWWSSSRQDFNTRTALASRIKRSLTIIYVLPQGHWASTPILPENINILTSLQRLFIPRYVADGSNATNERQ